MIDVLVLEMWMLHLPPTNILQPCLDIDHNQIHIQGLLSKGKM
jgi:hypothetical protein